VIVLKICKWVHQEEEECTDKIAMNIWMMEDLDKVKKYQMLLDMVMEYSIGQMELIMKVSGA
jgi:hypothetical protein